MLVESGYNQSKKIIEDHRDSRTAARVRGAGWREVLVIVQGKTLPAMPAKPKSNTKPEDGQAQQGLTVLIDLFGDLYPHYSTERIDGMITDYRSIYLSRGHTQTVVYPGVIEALSALPGRKATATTKGTPTTRAVLQPVRTDPIFRSCTRYRRHPVQACA